MRFCLLTAGGRCAGIGGEEEGEEGGGQPLTNKQKRSKVKSEKRLEQKQQRAREAKEATKKKSNKLMEVRPFFCPLFQSFLLSSWRM